jgi:hypothetical protein
MRNSKHTYLKRAKVADGLASYGSLIKQLQKVTYTCTENPNSLGDPQLVGWKAFVKDIRLSASN